MDPNPQQRKRQENTLSLLKVAIEAVNLAKEVSGPTPAKAVFGSVSILLSMIRVCFPLPFDYPSEGSHIIRTPCSTKSSTSSSG